MFIITNCTASGNYTPSKAETYEEAYAWMVECTAENIRNAYKYEFDGDTEPDSIWKLSDKEVIAWAKENADMYAFNITDNFSYVEYSDGNFNEMQIFDLDKI